MSLLYTARWLTLPDQFRVLIINSRWILCRIKRAHILQFNAMESVSPHHTTVPIQPSFQNFDINIPMNPGENFKIHVILFWSILKRHKPWVKITWVFWVPYMCLHLPHLPECNTSAHGHGLDVTFFLDCDPLQWTDSPKKCWWDARHLAHLPPKMKAQSRTRM